MTMQTEYYTQQSVWITLWMRWMRRAIWEHTRQMYFSIWSRYVQDEMYKIISHIKSYRVCVLCVLGARGYWAQKYVVFHLIHDNHISLALPLTNYYHRSLFLFLFLTLFRLAKLFMDWWFSIVYAYKLNGSLACTKKRTTPHHNHTLHPSVCVYSERLHCTETL